MTMMVSRYQDFQASALYPEQGFAASMQGGGPPAGWWADSAGDPSQDALRGRALPRAAYNSSSDASSRRGGAEWRRPQHPRLEGSSWGPGPMMHPAYLYDPQLYELPGSAPGLAHQSPLTHGTVAAASLGRITVPRVPDKRRPQPGRPGSPPRPLRSAPSPSGRTPATREPSSAESLSSMCRGPAMVQPVMARAQGGAPKWTAKDAEVALAKLKGPDPAERELVLEQVLRQAWPMSLMRRGCHVVQAALDVASAQQQLAMAGALRGHVWEALKSPHANHVLQRCVAVLPPGQVGFVLDELRGCAVSAARHHFGCRILQRLLEHCTAAQTAGLVEEVFGDLVELCRHPYGNYVVQHIIEHGLPHQRSRVAEAVWPEVHKLARHRISSHVMQSVFAHCALEEREGFAGDLEGLMYLQHSHWGSFVAKEMKKRRARRGEGRP